LNDHPVALPIARVPRLYFDYFLRNVPPERPKNANMVLADLAERPFYATALGWEHISRRPFITNFHRIRMALETAHEAGVLSFLPNKIAISRKYPGKETVYAIRGTYRFFHQGEKCK
jgi:hypothetical protein